MAIGDKKATRESYGMALAELGEKYDIVVMDADLSKSTKTDTFKKKFIEQLHNGSPTTITNTGERFYKLVYDTLCKIYNIN